MERRLSKKDLMELYGVDRVTIEDWRRNRGLNMKANNMIENISKEEAKHMVELLKKKSILVKNFSDKLEKYRISGDRETYNKKFKELLEKEEIKVYGKKIE